MKFIKVFEDYNKSKNNTEEYNGKKETWRLSNIHLDKENNLVGTCKGCGKVVEVSNQEHSVPCPFKYKE